MPPTQPIPPDIPHPRMEVADLKGEFGDTQLAVNYVFSWFTEENLSPFLQDTCIQVSNRQPTKCTCLHHVLNTMDSAVNNTRTMKEVSAYVVFFSRLKREERIREVMGWKKYADKIEKASLTKKSYCLPLTSTSDEYDDPNPDNNLMICANAMLAILGKGKKFWKTCCDATIRNTVPMHGSMGKTSNNILDPNSDVLISLGCFFEEMQELAEPRATRLVREMTNNGVRDDNQTLDLPAWTTKRDLYRRWCFEQGWKLNTTDMGNWKKTPRQDYASKLYFSCLPYLTCLHSNTFLLYAGVPSPDNLVSWTTFLSFWNKHYSNLVIRRPNADICVDCYIYANVFKLGLKKRDDSDEESSDDEAVACPLPAGADIFNLDEREKQILEAAEHVQLAKAQRELFNSYIGIAREDATNKVPHSERTYMRIGDYCQKMEMPYFGAEQPGDTYYMSPLTINCFGVVDPTGMHTDEEDAELTTQWRHILHAYVYAEGVAGCGGNNVASLLIKNLHDSGLLDPTKAPGGHLVAAFDNCPGQNKNNYVLKLLCAWLVEKRFFLKVSVVFLVKGHTKNPCDHLFNALKRVYRAQNIETFQDLMVILNKSEDVVAVEAKPEDFHDWATMFKDIYTNFPLVLKYHLFESEDVEDVSMQIGDGHPKEWTNLKEPKIENEELRAERLETLLPSVLTPPGVKEIKMVELWTKFRPFLKPINMDITCPYPGDEVMDRVKKTKRVKRASKKRKQVDITGG